MAPTRETLSVSDADPSRTYSPEEQRRLTENLLPLTEEVHSGSFSDREIDLSLPNELHRRLFDGVRQHAGQPRSPGRGDERLLFGPNRSVHRDEVAAELDRCLELARRSLRSLEDNVDDPTYEEVAFRLAVWTHAEIIRIHPYSDGNGRTSRLVMNCLLVRLGLRPVVVEMSKREYTDMLNAYFASNPRGLQPLIDSLLRIMGDALPDR